VNTKPNILTESCCTQMQLLSYLGNKLGAQESAKVEDHFTNCALCSDAIDGLFSLSADERKALMDNKNPFVKEEIKPLQVGYKKNRIWQIASVILLLIGVGLGINKWTENSEEHALAKNETVETTKNEIQSDGGVVTQNSTETVNDADKKINEIKTIETITPAKQNANDCPPGTTPNAKTPAVSPAQMADKYKDFEAKADENDGLKAEAVSEKVAIEESAKAIEKLPTEKPSEDAMVNVAVEEKAIAIRKKESVKNVLPAPVISNMSNYNYTNNISNNASTTFTGNATGSASAPANSSPTYNWNTKEALTVVSGKKQKTAKRNEKANVDDEVARKEDKKISVSESNELVLQSITNLYGNKKYNEAIAQAETFLQTKAGANNAKALYYMALSYASINNINTAIEKMKLVAKGKSEFAKLAVEKLKDWEK
jgi:hypothetical protein